MASSWSRLHPWSHGVGRFSASWLAESSIGAPHINVPEGLGEAGRIAGKVGRRPPWLKACPPAGRSRGSRRTPRPLRTAALPPSEGRRDPRAGSRHGLLFAAPLPLRSAAVRPVPSATRGGSAIAAVSRGAIAASRSSATPSVSFSSSRVVILVVVADQLGHAAPGRRSRLPRRRRRASEAGSRLPAAPASISEAPARRGFRHAIARADPRRRSRPPHRPRHRASSTACAIAVCGIGAFAKPADDRRLHGAEHVGAQQCQPMREVEALVAGKTAVPRRHHRLLRPNRGCRRHRRHRIIRRAAQIVQQHVLLFGGQPFHPVRRRLVEHPQRRAPRLAPRVDRVR